MPRHRLMISLRRKKGEMWKKEIICNYIVQYVVDANVHY